MTKPDVLRWGLTWEDRAILRLPRSPLAVGSLISAILIVSYLVFQWLLGFEIARTPAILALLVGYTLAANRYLSISLREEVTKRVVLAKLVDAPDWETAALGHPLAMIRASRLAGGGALLGGVALVQVIALALADDPMAPWHLGPHTAGIALLLLLAWLVGRGAYFSLVYPLGWQKRIEEHARDVLRDGAAASVDTPIDLLDLKPVYAQAAGGLRVALVWIVGVSIAGLFFLEQDARVILPILVTVSIGAAVGGAALLLQSRKLSAQIRTAKHSELEKLEAEIRRLRDAMLAGGPDPPGRLADLLGYETRIRNVSELPFEMATVRRLGLYLLIPLASMTGGALMERLVGLLLD